MLSREVWRFPSSWSSMLFVVLLPASAVWCFSEWSKDWHPDGILSTEDQPCESGYGSTGSCQQLTNSTISAALPQLFPQTSGSIASWQEMALQTCTGASCELGFFPVDVGFFPMDIELSGHSCRRPKAVLFPDRSVENLLNLSSRVHGVWMFWADCWGYCLGSSITDQEAAEPHYHTRGGKTHNKTEYCRGSETCSTIIIISSNICKTQSQLLELPLRSEFWWRAEPLQRYIWISLRSSQIFLC